MLLNYFPSKGDEKSKKMPFVLELKSFFFSFFSLHAWCVSQGAV